MRNFSTWLLLILSVLSFPLRAENQEQLNRLQQSIDELQKNLEKSGLEKEEIENELMFAGHSAYRFATDPSYKNGFVPRVRELVERISKGL